ncbi:TetR/AcrR family transcriptional regulator [Anoxybacillus sp. B7M1]
MKNGYEKASTDVITRRAGISKGLLFHYFNILQSRSLPLLNLAKLDESGR